jgi:TatD DNase family protein
VTLHPPAAGWVDSHGHLHDPAFAADRDAVAERAWAAGLSWIVDPGVDLATSHLAVAGARRWPGRVWAAAGVHPHEAAATSAEDLAALEALLDDPSVVAMGEIGLDAHRVLSPPEIQERILERQLGMAAARHLPVILHVRQTYARVLAMLGLSPRVTGVVHAFWGGPDVADAFLSRGFALGIGGPLTWRREADLRALVAAMPRDRLLLETDAPYLTPEPMRGRRNEPALVVHVGRRVAELWGQSVDEVRQTTAENARRLFFGRRSTGTSKVGDRD